jgi:hypothetical protein
MRLALVMTAFLSGCATAPPEATPAPCRNEALSGFVGQTASAAVGSAMLAQSGARVLRWVGFGQMVTMDYRGDRITVYLDSANRITRASCG